MVTVLRKLGSVLLDGALIVGAAVVYVAVGLFYVGREFVRKPSNFWGNR